MKLPGATLHDCKKNGHGSPVKGDIPKIYPEFRISQLNRPFFTRATAHLA